MIAEEAHEKLAVADAKLGNSIQGYTDQISLCTEFEISNLFKWYRSGEKDFTNKIVEKYWMKSTEKFIFDFMVNLDSDP